VLTDAHDAIRDAHEAIGLGSGDSHRTKKSGIQVGFLHSKSTSNPRLQTFKTPLAHSAQIQLKSHL
jgi:hypothetical protein